MANLAVETWLRFVVWLLVGLALYFGYSYSHSRVRADHLIVDSLHELEVSVHDVFFPDSRSKSAASASGVLTAVGVGVIVVEAFALLVGLIDIRAIPALAVWVLICVPIPGIVTGHIALAALERRSFAEGEHGGGDGDSVGIGAIRRVRRTLSIGYLTCAIAVVVGIVHAIMVL